MVDMRFLVACVVLWVHYSCGALAISNTTVKCRVKERLSLLSLKRGFVDPRGCLSSWGSSENHTDCCTWNGVSCDSRTGHVDALDLSYYSLEGNIPLNLGYLSRLQTLYLEGNQLEGGIPKSLALCNLTVLDLSDNSLSGQLDEFVASFDQCGSISLQNLDLSYNCFTGSVPNFSRFSVLERLYLSDNQLNGTVNGGIGLLSKLQTLDIASNFLHGIIAETHFSRLSQLGYLDMSLNNLEFKISPDWIPPFQLFHIHVRSCKLGPGFPNWLRTQKSDLSLDISNAEISESGFELKFVRRLNSIKFFTDSYGDYVDPNNRGPSSTEDIATLVWKGKVSKYQSILRLVKSIDLSCNMLMGEIPSELMDLVELVALNISRNMLSGKIPATIGQLKSLDFLDLSRNHLSGRIPSELSQVDRLGVMDLSHNNLSGEIPHGTQLQSFDPSAYEGNAHLCGAPLPKCPTSPTQDHPNDENSEEDEQIFGRGFFISSSIGLGTGFWGICSLIFLSKAFRYAYFRLMSGIHDKVYVIVAINVAKLRRWRRGST
ncbi:receptor-like protein EIX1 [Neltuma alba]|uniref:receptor-like protein EIX1 n=1 Tax=Neltuma alba TaxID=207710 RepID=UPI0010A4E69B|nr:receptor-like protein EIX1 [Prosopis alba]